MKEIIIVGTSSFAQLASFYFKHDYRYETTAFAERREFIKSNIIYEKPLIDIETMLREYNNKSIFIAIGYRDNNKIKEKMYNDLKEYIQFCTYISSNTTFYPEVSTVGSNCFIFENNVIQPFTSIGNNNTFWSGNHIGHHSIVGNHNFISSHVVIAGNCRIGDRNFFGVNSTIVDGITIGNDKFIKAGSLVKKDII